MGSEVKNIDRNQVVIRHCEERSNLLHREGKLSEIASQSLAMTNMPKLFFFIYFCLLIFISVDGQMRHRFHSADFISTYKTFNWTDKSFEVGSRRRIEVLYNLDATFIDSFPAADTIGWFMKVNPNLKIGVYVHTDQQGSETHNMALSKARAHGIANYLRSKYRIDSARLEWKGWGFTQLLIPTKVIRKEKNKHKRDSLYQINRRTEIVILRTDSSFAHEGTFNWSDKHFTVGTKRRIDVHFDIDKSNISDSNKVMGLDEESDRYNLLLFDTIINFMHKNPDLKIVINYHSDQDSATYVKTHWRINGPNRAQAVVNYLINKGILPERLVSHYIGDIKPVYLSYPIAPKEHGPIGYHPTHSTEIVILETDYKKEIK